MPESLLDQLNRMAEERQAEEKNLPPPPPPKKHDFSDEAGVLRFCRQCGLLSAESNDYLNGWAVCPPQFCQPVDLELRMQMRERVILHQMNQLRLHSAEREDIETNRPLRPLHTEHTYTLRQLVGGWNRREP